MSLTRNVSSLDHVTHPRGLKNLLLVSIRYWLPAGTIDMMMLSYLILVIIVFCNKWKVIFEGKIIDIFNRLRIHANGFLNE
jgi:hypothetical protein